MDGVIVISEPIYVAIEKEMFKDLGLDIGDEEHGGLAGMTIEGMWALVKERHGLTKSIEELVEQGEKMYMDKLQQSDLEAVKGVRRLIKNLKERGIKLAVATSSPRSRMELILGKLEVAMLFDEMVCADDITNGKPDPEIYLKAAEKLGVRPEDCVAIEDARNGVVAAKDAGMKVVGIRTNPVKQDFSMADTVIEEFNALRI